MLMTDKRVAKESCSRILFIAAIPLFTTTLVRGNVPSACAPCSYSLSSAAGPHCGPAESPTLGRGINEAGLVVGAYGLCLLGPSEAFVWDGRQELVTLGRPLGVDEAGAWDVNEWGWIVGQMVLTGVGDRAFIHDGTEFIDLGTFPDGTFSRGRAINDLGQVVGTWGNGIMGDPALAAFLWQDGVMIDLNMQLGMGHSEALDINEAGQVVGWMGPSTSTNGSRAFVWQGGNVIDLGVIPGGYTAVGEAISENGWVVGGGRVDAGGFTRAFLWNGSEMLNLGTLPGFDRGAASDVNDSGRVVGRSWGVAGNPNIESAFVWQDGVMTDLNDLIPTNSGAHITWATAINNQGQITGMATASANEVVAVLLTPVETAGDVDCDCTVGVVDLLALLAAWGPCADCEDCPADIDGNCDVGVTDLLTLLANWS